MNFKKLDDPGTNFTSVTLKCLKLTPNLINALKTLQEFAIQYRNKKNILDRKEQELDKPEENSKFQLFLKSFLADILIFTAALITVIITLIIIYMIYGQSKLKALVTNIGMQRIKAVEAGDMSNMFCTCKTQWYIMGILIIITLGMLYLVTNKLRKQASSKDVCFLITPKHCSLYLTPIHMSL